MDDFNTNDIIDEIISSPLAKRKENKESKSLDSTSELRRSTKSVTFVDQNETFEIGGKDDRTEFHALAGKTQEAVKPIKGRRVDDFDEETPPLGGLDTPRSEESSVSFPDDSPRKTSSSGGRGGDTAPAIVNAPKKGFDMFTTSSTVSEELAPRSKKNDFDSFLGSLNSYGATSVKAKDEIDDPLNSNGSAYQPWAASKSRPATGDAAMDIDSVLQSVDLTLKKRPVTAPAPAVTEKPAPADATEKPAKKTLSRLLADDGDDLFATAPVRSIQKQQRGTPQVQLSATIEGRTGPPPPSPPPPQAALAPSASELELIKSAVSDEMAPQQHPPLHDVTTDAGADDMFTVKRPPTGRRARGAENLGGLFEGDGKSADPFFSMPNIPLSNEMKIELESEIKKLRRERDDLMQQNEQLKQKARDEHVRAEDSHKKQLADTEELFRRREEMLLKESEQLKQKYGDTVRQMDQERANMRSEFHRQLDELAQEKRRDLDQLREQHRNDVEALRSAAPHAGALSNLVDRLGHLSEKLGTLSDRESSYRLKDEVYRQNEVTDRQTMHEIVQSLKVRVDESSRSERWLNDLATQLMEEQRALTAERAELRVLKLTEGARRAESEIERLARADERTRLEELEARLRLKRNEVLRLKSDLETLAEELKLKEEKLEDGQRSLDERLEIVSRREKALREQQARMDAASVEQAERVRRTEGIQSQLAELRAKEREVSQAMIQLAEERASLDKRAGGLLCANCRTPVRDSNAMAAAGVGGGLGLKLASSVDFAFAHSRSWDDLEEERLYLESLNHAPYG